jgi:hypothetical protein
LLVLAGCGRVAFEPVTPDTTEPDAEDACAVERQNLGPFGTPRRILATSTIDVEDDPVLSADMRELYFASNRPDSVGGQDIYVARRGEPSEPWSIVERVANLSSLNNDNTPALSSDGLELWVVSNRPGGMGGEDIWVSVRGSTTAPWPAPMLVPQLSSPNLDRGPAPFANDLRMVMHSNRPGTLGDTDFFETTRATRSAAWVTPVPLRTLNTPDAEIHAWMSPCGLRIFFQADRGALSGMDFYTASRASIDEDFGPEERIEELSTRAYDQDIHVSRDLRHVVFSSDISGDGELYEASR